MASVGNYIRQQWATMRKAEDVCTLSERIKAVDTN